MKTIGLKSLRFTLTAAALLCLAGPAQAADKVKVGFVSTLVGPVAGAGRGHPRRLPAGRQAQRRQARRPAGRGDRRRRPVKPDVGQAAARRKHQARQGRLHDRRGVLQHHAGRGCPSVRSQDLLHQPQRRPVAVRGQGLQPVLLRAVVARTTPARGRGQVRADKGYKNVYLLAPNYQAGKDALAGFKRYLQGPGGRRDLHQARPARLRGRAGARSAPPSRTRCTSSCPAAWASTSSSSSSAPACPRT